MFSISVCMIVKNEEATLGRILQCVKSFADEIVVVDTGSTDKSKQIASSFGAKVFDFKWNDDFSAARNFAFSKGSSDYLMWLDADDFITDENIQKILDLKSSAPQADVYMCNYKFGNLTYERERILRRSKNFLWQGFVHEVIVPSGKIVKTDIEIEHRKVRTSDGQRNLIIYQKALKNGAKFNAREQYYYARELFYNSRFSKAASELKKFLKMPYIFPPDALGAHIMLSDCLFHIGKTEDALKALFAAQMKFVPTSELCCKIAYIFNFLNRPDSAIFWFKAALVCPPQTQGFVVKDFQELIPCIELSRLLYRLDFNQAKSYHEAAKKIAPQNAYVQFNEQFFK